MVNFMPDGWCVNEACILYIVVGDDSLENALKQDECLSMDKVYDALDWYRMAVIEAREIEVRWYKHHLVLFCCLLAVVEGYV